MRHSATILLDSLFVRLPGHTPDRVDSRSLRDLSIISAAYLYFLANAREPEAPWLAPVSQTRGYQQFLDAASPFLDQIDGACDEVAQQVAGRGSGQNKLLRRAAKPGGLFRAHLPAAYFRLMAAGAA